MTYNKNKRLATIRCVGRGISAGLLALAMTCAPMTAYAADGGTDVAAQAAAQAAASSSDFYGATAQPFQIWGEQGLRNIKVVWGRAHSYHSYKIERRVNGGEYKVIAQAAKGNTYDDYGLDADATYQYRVSVNEHSGWTGETNEARTRSTMPEADYQYYDNLQFDEDSPVSALSAAASSTASDTSDGNAENCSVKLVQTRDTVRWAALHETCEENGTTRERDIYTGGCGGNMALHCA